MTSIIDDETKSILDEFCKEMDKIKSELPKQIAETSESEQLETFARLLKSEQQKLAKSFKDPLELKLINDEIAKEAIQILREVSNQGEYKGAFNVITVKSNDNVKSDTILFYNSITKKRHINKEATVYKQFQDKIKHRINISSNRDNSSSFSRYTKLTIAAGLGLCSFIYYKFRDSGVDIMGYGFTGYKKKAASAFSSGPTGFEESNSINSLQGNLTNISQHDLGGITASLSSNLGNSEQNGVISLMAGSGDIWGLITQRHDDFLNPDIALMKKKSKEIFVEKGVWFINIMTKGIIGIVAATALISAYGVAAGAAIAGAAGFLGLITLYLLSKIAKKFMHMLGLGNDSMTKFFRNVSNIALFTRFNNLIRWFIGKVSNKEEGAVILLSDVYVDDFWSSVTESSEVLKILEKTISNRNNTEIDKLYTLIGSMRDNYLISKLKTPEDVVKNSENKNILSSSYETNIVYGYEKDLVREYKTQFLENIFQSVKIKKQLNEEDMVEDILDILERNYINYETYHRGHYHDQREDVETNMRFILNEEFNSYISIYKNYRSTKGDLEKLFTARNGKRNGSKTEPIEKQALRNLINDKYPHAQVDDEGRYLVDTSNDIIKEYIFELKKNLATMRFNAFRQTYKNADKPGFDTLKTLIKDHIELIGNNMIELEKKRNYAGFIGILLGQIIDNYIEIDVINMINANLLNGEVRNSDDVTAEDIDNTSSILLTKMFKTNKKILEALLIPTALEFPIKKYNENDINSKTFHAQSTVTSFLKQKVLKLAIKSTIYNTSYLLKLAFLEMMNKFQITPAKNILNFSTIGRKGTFGLAYKTELESHRGSDILGYKKIGDVRDINKEPDTLQDLTKEIAYLDSSSLITFFEKYKKFMFKTGLYEPLKYKKIIEACPDNNFKKVLCDKFINETNAEYTFKNGSIYPHQVLIAHSIYAGDKLNKVDNETEVNLDMILTKQFKSLIGRALGVLKKFPIKDDFKVSFDKDEILEVSKDDDRYKNYKYNDSTGTYNAVCFEDNEKKYIIKKDYTDIVKLADWQKAGEEGAEFREGIKMINEQILDNLGIENIDELTETCLSSGSRYLLIEEDKGELKIRYLNYIPNGRTNLRVILNMEALTKIYSMESELDKKSVKLDELTSYEKGIFDGIYNSSNFKAEIDLYINGLYHKRLYNIHSNNLLDILYNKNNCFHEVTIEFNNENKKHMKIFKVNEFNSLHNWVGTNFPEISKLYNERILWDSDRIFTVDTCRDQTYLCRANKWTDAINDPTLKWDKDYLDGLLSIIIGSYGNFRGALKTTSQYGAFLYYLHHLPYNNGIHYLYPDEKGLLYDSYSFSLYLTKLSNELSEGGSDNNLDKINDLMSLKIFKELKKKSTTYNFTISDDFKFNYLLAYTHLVYNNNLIADKVIKVTKTSGKVHSLNNIGFMLSCHDINSLAIYSNNESIIDNKDFNIDGIYGNGVALVAKNLLPSLNRALPMLPLGLQLMDQKYWFYYDPLRNKNILQCEGTVEEIEDSVANLTSNTLEKRLSFQDITDFTHKLSGIKDVINAVEKIRVRAPGEKANEKSEYENLAHNVKTNIITHLYCLSLIVKLRNMSKIGGGKMKENIILNLNSETWRFTSLEKYKTHTNKFQFENNKEFANQLLYLKLETFSRLIKIYITNKHSQTGYGENSTQWEKLNENRLLDLIKPEDIQMIRNYPLLNEANIINNLLYSTTVSNLKNNSNILEADILVKPQRSMGSDLTATISGLVNNIAAKAAHESQEHWLAGTDRVASNFYSSIMDELIQTEVIHIKFRGGEIDQGNSAFKLDNKIIKAYEHIFGKIDPNFMDSFPKIQKRFYHNIIQKTSNLSIRNYITQTVIGLDLTNDGYYFDGIKVPEVNGDLPQDMYSDYIYNILNSNFQIGFSPKDKTLELVVDNTEDKNILKTLLDVRESGDTSKQTLKTSTKNKILTKCMTQMNKSIFCHTGCTHTNANASEMFYNTLILGKFLSTNITLDPIASAYYDIDDYEDISSLPQQGDHAIFYNRYNEFIQKNYSCHFGNNDKPGLFCTGHSMGGGYSSTFGYMTMFQAVKYRRDSKLIKELSQISAETKVHSFAPPRAFNLTTSVISEFLYKDLFDLLRDDVVQGNIVVNISNKGDPIQKVPFIFSHIGSVVLHDETIVNKPGKLLWDTEKALYSNKDLYLKEIEGYIEKIKSTINVSNTELIEAADGLKTSIADMRYYKLTKNIAEVSNNNFMTYVFKNPETPGNSMGFEIEFLSDINCVINHFNNLYVQCVEQKLINLGLLTNNIAKEEKEYVIAKKELRNQLDENKHRPIEYVVENIVELINLLNLSQAKPALLTSKKLKQSVLNKKFMRQFSTTRNEIETNTRTNYQINYNYESFDELADKLSLCREELIGLVNLIRTKNLSLHDDFWNLPADEYILYSNENVDMNPGLLSSALYSRYAQDKFREVPMDVASNYLEVITSDIDIATESVTLSSSNIKSRTATNGKTLYYNDTSGSADKNQALFSNRLIYDFKNWLTSNYSLETLFCNRSIVRNIVCKPKKILFSDEHEKLSFSDLFCLETNKYYGYDQSWAGPTQHSTQKYLMYAYMANSYSNILNTCQMVIKELAKNVKCNEGSVESISKMIFNVESKYYNQLESKYYDQRDSFDDDFSPATLLGGDASLSLIIKEIKYFLDITSIELNRYLIDDLGATYFAIAPHDYDNKKRTVYKVIANLTQSNESDYVLTLGIRGPSYWQTNRWSKAGWGDLKDDIISIKVILTDYEENPALKAAITYIINGLNYYNDFHTGQGNNEDFKPIMKEQLFELLNLFILDNDKPCKKLTTEEKETEEQILDIARRIDDSEADFATLLIGDGTSDN